MNHGWDSMQLQFQKYEIKKAKQKKKPGKFSLK